MKHLKHNQFEKKNVFFCNISGYKKNAMKLLGYFLKLRKLDQLVHVRAFKIHIKMSEFNHFISKLDVTL